MDWTALVTLQSVFIIKSDWSTVSFPDYGLVLMCFPLESRKDICLPPDLESSGYYTEESAGF